MRSDKDRTIPSPVFPIIGRFVVVQGSIKLGRSQAVRQGPLKPPCVGSNPTAPANKIFHPSWVEYFCLDTVGFEREGIGERKLPVGGDQVYLF